LCKTNNGEYTAKQEEERFSHIGLINGLWSVEQNLFIKIR